MNAAAMEEIRFRHSNPRIPSDDEDFDGVEFDDQDMDFLARAGPIESRFKRSPAEAIRERAWERRRHIEQQKSRKVVRSSSDCSSQSTLRKQAMEDMRPNRSLTKEDFEELRGCIDLGFRFCGKEDPQLCNTLPALEFCYAVNRQYQEMQTDSSSCSSSPSAESSPSSSWRISNPGDELQQVKEKLRHWARAVACISRQSC